MTKSVCPIAFPIISFFFSFFKWGLKFSNFFYGLFHRWIREINHLDLRGNKQHCNVLFPRPWTQNSFPPRSPQSPRCRLLWKQFGRHPTPHLDQEEPHSFCLSDVSAGRFQSLYEMSTKLLHFSKYHQNRPASIYLPHFLRFSSYQKKNKKSYLPFPRTWHQSSPVFFFKPPLSSQTTSPSVSNCLPSKDFSPFLALPSSKLPISQGPATSSESDFTPFPNIK